MYENGTSEHVAANNSSNPLLYKVNLEGHVSGPSDFYVENDDVFILNSANNSLTQYDDGQMSRNISFDDYGIIAMYITVYGNEIYALGTDLSVVTISEDGESVSESLAEYIDSEGVSDFFIDGNKLFISTAEIPGAKTYVFDLNSNGLADSPETFNGRALDSNVRYLSLLNTTTEKTLSNSGTIKITDVAANTIVQLNITSSYYLTGMRLLRCNSDGTFDILVTEATQDSNNILHTTSTIRRYDSGSNIVEIFQIGQQVCHATNPVKNFDGEIYSMSSQENSFGVIQIPESYGRVSSYISPLAAYYSPYTNANTTDTAVPSNAEAVANAVYIYRSTIVNNMLLYHDAFEWSCTNQNVINGVTPSYIIQNRNNAGISATDTNSSWQNNGMPYCWGCGHSREQFVAGIQNGGTAGNNSHTSRYGCYGQDCSGYVSRCWGQSTHYYTGSLPSIGQSIDWDELRMGDAIISQDLGQGVGHAAMFYIWVGDTSVGVYESSTSHGRVAYNVYSSSELSTYSAYQYKYLM